MLIDISNTFMDKSFIFQVQAFKNCDGDFIDDRYIDSENDFISNKSDIIFFSEKTKSNSILPPMISSYSILSFIEEEEENRNDNHLFYLDTPLEKENERQPYFKVVYPKDDSLLNKITRTENISILIREEEEEVEKPFLGKKKLLNVKTRKDNQDNMRKKIKRGFYNTSLIKFLNELLKSIGTKKYFEKFPHNFVNDVNQKRNKKIFGMTLREVLVEKKLYIHEENSGFNNYSHNLKVVQSEEIKENEEFKKILDKTIRELYEEYINSDEFKIGEINGLRKKEMTDEYIERYIYLANHFTEFLFQ
jgi:hypothetical protein